MKAFHFTLEAVGILRRLQEQRAMEQYARRLAVSRQAMDRLAAMESDLEDCRQEWRGQLTGGCRAADAARALNYQNQLASQQEDCALAAQTAERRAEAALQNFLQARQQREIVDRFFDKQKERHRRDLARGEQKFLDDLAGRRGQSIFAWRPVESPL